MSEQIVFKSRKIKNLRQRKQSTDEEDNEEENPSDILLVKPYIVQLQSIVLYQKLG